MITFTSLRLPNIFPHLLDNASLSSAPHKNDFSHTQVSKPGIFPVLLFILTGKRHTSRHAPDITSEGLLCMPMTFSIQSLAFKSVTRVPNRKTGLVCFGVIAPERRRSQSLIMPIFLQMLLCVWMLAGLSEVHT
jgi:hypothetical protein